MLNNPRDLPLKLILSEMSKNWMTPGGEAFRSNTLMVPVCSTMYSREEVPSFFRSTGKVNLVLKGCTKTEAVAPRLIKVEVVVKPDGID